MVSARSGMRRWRPCAQVLAFAVAQMGSVNALAGADGETFKLRAAPTIGYDSNIFRLPSDASPTTTGSSSRGDVIGILSLGANVDWNLGRQRVLVDASVAENRYSRFKFLDNRSSEVRSSFFWQIGNDLSGELGYSRAESLTTFDNIRQPIKNVQTVQRTSGSALYRLYPRMGVRGGLSRSTLSNATPQRRPNDREDDSYEAGVQYLSSAGSVIGVQARRTEGGPANSQPVVGAPVSVKFTQTDVETTVDWQVTGVSKLVGSVGYTTRKNEGAGVRDFSGPSARLRHDWQRGKVLVTTALRREVGAFEDTETNYVLTEAISVGATWAATAKVTARASFEHRVRQFLGDPGFVAAAGPSREDKINVASVGVSYAPIRSVQVSLAASHETRSSNRASFGYRATSGFATAQFAF